MAIPKSLGEVPWGEPEQCPTCTGEVRRREYEGTTEFDPIRLDPTDIEECLRVAEIFVGFVRDSVNTLDSLDDEGADVLGADAKRLLLLWTRFSTIAQARVERARAAAEELPPAPEKEAPGGC